MPEAASLTKVKLRLGLSVTTYDALLADILTDAEYFILGYTNQATLPAALLGAQCEIAVMMYNRRGAEGQSAHSEGGMSITIDTLPAALVKQLNAYRLAKVVSTLA